MEQHIVGLTMLAECGITTQKCPQIQEKGVLKRFLGFLKLSSGFLKLFPGFPEMFPGYQKFCETFQTNLSDIVPRMLRSVISALALLTSIACQQVGRNSECQV